MRTEELRAELRTLADEIVAFEPDLLALHRRNRQHTWLRIGAAAAAVLVIGAVLAALSRGGSHVHVSSPEKEVELDQLHRVDVLVVPADKATQRVLEASGLVDRYTRVTTYKAGIDSGATKEQRLAAAALLQTDAGGFAIQALDRADVVRDALRKKLPASAQVFAIPWKNGDDAELFMKPAAPTQAVEAVRAAIVADPQDIATFTFFDHEQAYEEFKRIFADQPALIESTSPRQLPESFRLRYTPTVSIHALEARLRAMPGVETIVSADPSQEFDSAPASTVAP